MVELMDRGLGEARRAASPAVIDADVHEELRSVSELVPYLAEPWKNRVAMIESSWTWVPSTMWRLDHSYRSLRREVPWVKRCRANT